MKMVYNKISKWFDLAAKTTSKARQSPIMNQSIFCDQYNDLFIKIQNECNDNLVFTKKSYEFVCFTSQVLGSFLN